jgi:Zn-dependent protease with chaperone function
MYYLLGISVALASFLIINLTVSVVASLAWRAMSGLFEGATLGTRARLIFGLRVLPIVVASIAVFAFIVPGYLLHERENSGEIVSNELALLGIVSLVSILIAICRVIRSGLATRRLMREWFRSSSKVEITGIDVPIYQIEHEFPVLAVVGIWKPRIFVAEKVLTSLGESEFRAAIAHEYGHLVGRDNLKTTVLAFCRDLLFLPIARGLDKAWVQNAEALADEFAATTSGRVALDLASALVKITRIVPASPKPLLPAGAYIVSHREVDVAERVRRLLKMTETGRSSGPLDRSWPFSAYVWAVLLFSMLFLHILDQRLLLVTHNGTEHFVRFFQ